MFIEPNISFHYHIPNNETSLRLITPADVQQKFIGSTKVCKNTLSNGLCFFQITDENFSDFYSDVKLNFKRIE